MAWIPKKGAIMRKPHPLLVLVLLIAAAGSVGARRGDATCSWADAGVAVSSMTVSGLEKIANKRLDSQNTRVYHVLQM